MSETKASHPLLDQLTKLGADTKVIDDARALTSEDIAKFLGMVDESPYSILEWAEAVVSFEAWAKKEKRSLTLLHELEYLSCCAESARGGIKLPLPFLLQEFLKTNGVE